MISELNARELVQDLVELVSFPEIALKISGMIDDPRYDACDFGKLIGQDPAMTSRVLKIANSPLYGFQGKIDNVTRAVTVIGMRELRNLILATSAVETFSRIPQDLIDMTDFWVRSLQCGIFARLLAKKCSVLQPESLFVAGLLSDIGSLVMYHKIPDECREILISAGGNRSLVAELEQEMLGFTHAEVAGELALIWSFPEALIDAVGRYLKPMTADKHWLNAHLVHLANRLCEVSIQGRALDDLLAEIPPEILNALALEREAIVEVIEAIGIEFSEIFDLIIPDEMLLH